MSAQLIFMACRGTKWLDIDLQQIPKFLLLDVRIISPFGVDFKMVDSLIGRSDRIIVLVTICI